METAFALKWSWKLSIVLVMALGLMAGVAALLELTGAVAPDSSLRGASDVERYCAVVVGLGMQPLAGLALRMGTLRIGARTIRYPDVAPLPCVRELAFSDVARWGHGLVSHRGRRSRQLLFERRDSAEITIRLAMYEGESRVLELLEQRLGAPSPTAASFSGLRFP